jgi:curved DNA-binding protein CbpA
MSFRIEKGLFALDFTDQHAILGMSLDAEVKEIRKRYLSIARRLHPDSLTTATPEQKKEANQLLSKLVNPAYEVLSQEKNRGEYALLLKLKGQQAIQQKLSLNDFNDAAKLLAKTNNLDHVYRQSLATLNEGLYDDIATIEEKINALSELNLVYAMRKAAAGGRPGPAPAPTTGTPAASATPTNSGATAATAATASSSMNSTTVPSASAGSPIDNYLRRAEAYITKKAFSQAILELRDAIRVAPNDSRCHSLMGVVYLAQGQAAMARSYVRRALELNPEDQRANACKKRLESMGHSLDSASTTPANSKNASGKSSNGDDKSSKGLFGGLFGGKKKS